MSRSKFENKFLDFTHGQIGGRHDINIGYYGNAKSTVRNTTLAVGMMSQNVLQSNFQSNTGKHTVCFSIVEKTSVLETVGKNNLRQVPYTEQSWVDM